MQKHIIIIGGGLAGLCSAIHLGRDERISVTLIEKNEFPKHKVCGEYISNEVLTYLKSLGFDPFKHGAKNITDFTLSTPGSRAISTVLPLGGFSISRYRIDYELSKIAQSHGVEIVQDVVEGVSFSEEQFTVTTRKGEALHADVVMGAFGKRSSLDVKLDRDFIKKPSPFLGVKAHYKGEYPDPHVGLHNFEGGYCGVSRVETDAINICYIADFKSFKKYKNIDQFQKAVLYKNKHLKAVLKRSELLFDKPLTISQVSFASKAPVEDHVLMCGDAAGMIHPLAGNGMSMAIRAAQMASRLVLKFVNGDINRQQLEKQYAKEWNGEFSSRLKSGHIIARLFRLGVFSEILMILLKMVPFVLPTIIKRTHGKPMTAN